MGFILFSANLKLGVLLEIFKSSSKCKKPRNYHLLAASIQIISPAAKHYTDSNTILRQVTESCSRTL